MRARRGDDDVASVAEAYVALKERGQQLFDGLRDLPQFGKRLWEPYFRRTFDVYNQLWKYQQEHRCTLEAEYGLKRHEIGEIASRIGQLYYQFYLRKGDTCYLDEAYVFYEAIRARQYLGSPEAVADSKVVLRRLRYYTRFCVVCMLTGRRGLLLELLVELEQLVPSQAAALSDAELAEWSHLLREFRSFVKVEQPLTVLHAPLAAAGGGGSAGAATGSMVPVELQRRLCFEQVQPQDEVVRSSPAGRLEPPLVLSEVVLAGTCASQLKFQDLHLDSFRMLHALEWGAGSLKQQQPDQRMAAERVNPHKYILHRATAAQLALVLATAMVEIPPGGALLLYLSADGLHTASSVAAGSADKAEPQGLWQQGGLALAADDGSAAARQSCCWRPADLWPFCRMPLFLVVESDNAAAFRALPAAAPGGGSPSAPLFCLLANRPKAATKSPQLAGGGLLTLFLQDPLGAFAVLGGVSKMPQATHEKLEQMLVSSFTQTTRALLACAETPHACLAFLSDPFLRTLVLRYIFCHATVCLFKSPKGGPPALPECIPPLPDAVLLDEKTLAIVRNLAAVLGITSRFHASPPLAIVGLSAP